MNSVNSNRFMVTSNKHISNINRALKYIKFDVMANFIQVDYRRLVMTFIATNEVMSTLDINTIERYIKNIDTIDSNKVMSPRYLQSRSYLKILGILYICEDSNTPLHLTLLRKSFNSHISSMILFLSFDLK